MGRLPQLGHAGRLGRLLVASLAGRRNLTRGRPGARSPLVPPAAPVGRIPPLLPPVPACPARSSRLSRLPRRSSSLPRRSSLLPHRPSPLHEGSHFGRQWQRLGQRPPVDDMEEESNKQNVAGAAGVDHPGFGEHG